MGRFPNEAFLSNDQGSDVSEVIPNRSRPQELNVEGREDEVNMQDIVILLILTE
jgi:hypothetical protein